MQDSTAPLFSEPEVDPVVLARHFCTVEELANMLRVSPATIMRWAREEGMPRQSHGRYPLVPVIQWYADRHHGNANRASSELEEERRKLITSQRIGQDLANQKVRGELIDAALVQTAIQHMGALIATQLDGLAPRVSSQLSQLRDPVAIARVLSDECRSIRQAASQAVSNFGVGLSEEPAPAAPVKRRRRAARP